jgi:general secretion pathway protein K
MAGGPRRGFALLIVLFVLALVGVAAVEFHTALSADRRIAANTRAAARARWGARGGLARELARLQDAVRVTALAAERLAPVGDTLLPARTTRTAGMEVRSTVLDVRARLHVNRATEAELAALGEAVGLSRVEAASFAARVLDWRDPDDMPRPGGAERAEYAAARVAARPSNAPFDDVAEVADVFGVTPGLQRRLARLLTTAGDARINVNSAPVEVLRTMPGVDGQAARALAERRAASPFGSVYDVMGALPEPARATLRANLAAVGDRVATAPRHVEVRVRSVVSGGDVGAELSALVHLAGGAQMQLVEAVEREVRATAAPTSTTTPP